MGGPARGPDGWRSYPPKCRARSHAITNLDADALEVGGVPRDPENRVSPVDGAAVGTSDGFGPRRSSPGQSGDGPVTAGAYQLTWVAENVYRWET
jgi:hypothetical protein